MFFSSVGDYKTRGRSLISGGGREEEVEEESGGMTRRVAGERCGTGMFGVSLLGLGVGGCFGCGKRRGVDI